ncbi:MAG: hypothetical protein JWQ40_1217 [Segetibacter sp.]|jgi:hypothetical protein|nr:hypothetical protein [Segetibacter sp.]
MNKFICSLILLIVLLIPSTHAQNDMNYLVHANIIFRFTKYVNWPDEKKSGDFIIGIVGNTPLYDNLKTFIVNKTVGNQKIVLRKFSSSSPVFDCHILFLSEHSNRYLKRVVNATARSSVLLVSEGEDLAQRGACINFKVENERLKLEINKNNIRERNLDVANELLSLAVIVK